MHQYKLRFWQQWLLHAFIVWFVLTLYNLLSYFYKIQRWGNYIFKEDGTPFTVWESFVSYNYDQLVWLDIALLAFLAEVNYHFIFKRRSTSQFIACSLACGLASALYFVARDFFRGTNIDQTLDILLPVFAFMALYGLLYALLRDYVYRRIYIAENRLQQSQAELNTLKAQVNPHFFFNTLNSLYGTSLEEHAPRTAESIDHLAGIMRYTMNEAQQDFTAVTNEIRFLEDYLHLQRLRLPERRNIDIKTEINYDSTPCTIAPMLLIPFIENAFKYGISIDHTCWVHLHLAIENQQLYLLIQNKILRENAAAKGQGTGIENARKRLQLLYPGKHELDISEQEVFITELKLSLN